MIESNSNSCVRVDGTVNVIESSLSTALIPL